jgi:hypothetical protein
MEGDNRTVEPMPKNAESSAPAPGPASAGPGGPHAVETMITTAVVTAAVVPFLQGLVTKAAEDSYQAVRAALRRRFAQARGAEAEPEATGQPLLIVNGGTVVLYVRPEMNDEAIRGLAGLVEVVDAGDPAASKVQIFWNETDGRWQIDRR